MYKNQPYRHWYRGLEPLQLSSLARPLAQIPKEIGQLPEEIGREITSFLSPEESDRFMRAVIPPLSRLRNLSYDVEIKGPLGQNQETNLYQLAALSIVV